MASTAAMLRRLAVVQHVLFLVLVAVGVVRAVTTGAGLLPLVLTTAALLLWYAVGARWAAAGRTGSPHTPAPATPRLGRGGWWLLGLTLVWLTTVLVSPENVWVSFSLWLLAGHLLPLRLAVVFSVLVLAVVLVATGEHLEVAEVVGPSVGMVFALALSRGQQLLVRDGLERERLLTSLLAAQEETEVLHAELAEAQRSAGVLEERTRLSRDIHDSLAQGFSSILLLARAGAATPDPSAGRRLLAQIETSAADGLDEARRVVGALAPAPLESGLAEALRRLVGRLEEETGVCGELRVEGDVTSLPPRLEVALLRVAQSALANVRQHAAATQVVLTLAEAEDSVRLDIVDDGRGFDVGVVLGEGASAGRDVTRGGYGLRASRQRLRELGGDLDVESEAGAGTAVSASVPRVGVPAVEVPGEGDGHG